MGYNFEDVSRFALENLYMVTTKNGGREFVARCPFCNDSKKKKKLKRFHLTFKNEDSVIFHCYNCDIAGPFHRLYAHVKGISEADALKELRSFSAEKIKKRFSKPVEIAGEKIEETPADLSWILEDVVDKETPGFKAKKLIEALEDWKKRRRLEDYVFFVAHKGKYANRIIIPVYEDGELVYFQGRAIIDSLQPKYLNAMSEKSDIIFNKHKFSAEKYIVITEGILDAMSIPDHQGTACLGASIDDSFIEKLLPLTKKGIIVALDNDSTGIERTQRFMKKSKYASKVLYFIMPDEYEKYKDMNQLRTSTELELYDFVVENSHTKFRAEVIYKLKGFNK